MLLPQNILNSKNNNETSRFRTVDEDSVLVAITASREEGEIVYRVECSNQLSNDEFEYYLGELISGVCKWKKDICEENVRSFKGKIQERK